MDAVSNGEAWVFWLVKWATWISHRYREDRGETWWSIWIWWLGMPDRWLLREKVTKFWVALCERLEKVYCLICFCVDFQATIEYGGICIDMHGIAWVSLDFNLEMNETRRRKFGGNCQSWGSNIAHFARDSLWLHGISNETLEALGFPQRKVERVLTKFAATQCLENGPCSKTGSQRLFEMQQLMEEVALDFWQLWFRCRQTLLV